MAGHAIQADADPTARLTEMTRRVISRPPTPHETAILVRELDQALIYYRSHHADARKFLSQTNYQHSEQTQSDAELASYTLVASMILNLDEALNHE
ncbi:MAG: hypothetical protein WCH39_10725, partial [Schlesneria sp.]